MVRAMGRVKVMVRVWARAMWSRSAMGR